MVLYQEFCLISQQLAVLSSNSQQLYLTKPPNGCFRIKNFQGAFGNLGAAQEWTLVFRYKRYLLHNINHFYSQKLVLCVFAKNVIFSKVTT